jgi:FKBP-type peptidyl-prolyl cis-trans isomerase
MTSSLVRSLSLAAIIFSIGCGGSSSPTSPSSESVPYSTTDLRVGTGAEATAGRTATVGYQGWLYSSTAAENKGARFDAGTFTLVAGGNQAIAGFSRGVVGMRVGGLRRVVIPPSLGYGSQGSGPIPGNATLVFEMELLSVQ